MAGKAEVFWPSCPRALPAAHAQPAAHARPAPVPSCLAPPAAAAADKWTSAGGSTRAGFIADHIALHPTATAQKDATIMAANGTVLLPAEDGAATGGDSNQTYYGSILADNVLLSGQPLEVVDGVATAEECGRLCRSTDQCSLFQYCNQTGGCVFQYGPYTVELEHEQCESGCFRDCLTLRGCLAHNCA